VKARAAIRAATAADQVENVARALPELVREDA